LQYPNVSKNLFQKRRKGFQISNFIQSVAEVKIPHKPRFNWKKREHKGVKDLQSM